MIQRGKTPELNSNSTVNHIFSEVNPLSSFRPIFHYAAPYTLSRDLDSIVEFELNPQNFNSVPRLI